jgi:hypothetical protein
MQRHHVRPGVIYQHQLISQPLSRNIESSTRTYVTGSPDDGNLHLSPPVAN